MPIPSTLPALPQYLIAHRGWPARAPENSDLGFALARAAGAPVVELDVRPSADGRLVVIHDETPERITGDRRLVWEQTLVELRARPLLSDPRLRLATLDEALAQLAHRTLVDIELKAGGAEPRAICEMLFGALSRCGSPPNVVVTSDTPELIAEVKVHGPAISTGLVLRWRDDAARLDEVRETGAELVVANHRRIDDTMLNWAGANDVTLWAYTVNSADQARSLFDKGVRGVVTDDFGRMRDELFGPAISGASASTANADGNEVAVIDLGSSAIKLSVVNARGAVIAKASRPTPTSAEAGRIEHDAESCLQAVRSLIDEVSAICPAPAAAALATQRSTGLWCEPSSLGPLTPAVSWRDVRGEPVVEKLAARRDDLEARSGLPMLAAWTAIVGSVTREQYGIDPRAMLLPLGSWLAARLTGQPARIDPTLANRTFLLDADTLEWSDVLLDAFGVHVEQLPQLVPSVADHGAFDWGDRRVPLTAFVGDQQAAFVGAAGPLGERIVLNLGTAAFVMRSLEKRAAVDVTTRCAPLWTSTTRPRPPRYLLERPLIEPAPWVDDRESPLSLHEKLAGTVAEQYAAGDARLAQYVTTLAEATAKLIGPRDRTLVLSGGAAVSPHLVHLLDQKLPLAPTVATHDLTAVGAARLAAAFARLGWTVK